MENRFGGGRRVAARRLSRWWPLSACVAQGFEFGRIGVIWGRDLVWRTDRWVAQPAESWDVPVKQAASDTLTLLRNAYRVLLTRGLRGARLLVLDAETRRHIEQALRLAQG